VIMLPAIVVAIDKKTAQPDEFPVEAQTV